MPCLLRKDWMVCLRGRMMSLKHYPIRENALGTGETK
jgi:hypothetical protein